MSHNCIYIDIYMFVDIYMNIDIICMYLYIFISLIKVWFKWTFDNHTFESVTLTKADQDGFSGAVKEVHDCLYM
jgi:uncharacterized membrane protein